MAYNIGTMLTTTLKNYRKTLTDNIHESNAIFYLLKKEGAIKMENGGERIVEPLMMGKNDTAGSYSGYDRLNVTPQGGIDSAEYNWKQYSASITISGDELRKNKGSKTRIINLLGARTDQAEMSLTSELVAGLFSDGTGNSGKDLTGLEAMVLASGTYGGINSAVETYWQANIDGDDTTLALADMRAVFNSCSLGGKNSPNMIVTTQSLFQDYEAFFTQVAISGGGSNFTTPSGSQKTVADGGFQTLSFKGAAITWDEQAPAETMYMLNTKYMKLVVHEDANFETTDFIKPVDQDALVAQVLWQGNLTCSRRKSFGALRAKG